jgi:integrase
MTLLAYRHGMRASEVSNVRLDDLDLRRQAITVRRLKRSLNTVQPLYWHRSLPLLEPNWQMLGPVRHIKLFRTGLVRVLDWPAQKPH